MKLPTIDLLTKAVIGFGCADFVFFFYAGYPGFASDAVTLVKVFTYLSMALLFLCAKRRGVACGAGPVD